MHSLPRQLPARRQARCPVKATTSCWRGPRRAGHAQTPHMSGTLPTLLTGTQVPRPLGDASGGTTWSGAEDRRARPGRGSTRSPRWLRNRHPSLAAPATDRNTQPPPAVAPRQSTVGCRTSACGAGPALPRHAVLGVLLWRGRREHRKGIGSGMTASMPSEVVQLGGTCVRSPEFADVWRRASDVRPSMTTTRRPCSSSIAAHHSSGAYGLESGRSAWSSTSWARTFRDDHDRAGGADGSGAPEERCPRSRSCRRESVGVVGPLLRRPA